MNYFIHLANAMSVMRILLTPIFMWLLVQQTLTSVGLAIVVFTIAALSDTCDGYFARRFGIVSEIGSFLDPMADKILITGAFGVLWFLGVVPLWFVIILVMRDVVITKLRTLLLQSGTSLQTSQLGKWKTFLQFIVIYSLFFYLVMHHDEQVSQQLLTITGYVASVLIYGIALLTVYSGIDYLYRARYFVWHWGMRQYYAKTLNHVNDIPFFVDVCASCGYVGYIPYVSGTAASLFTVIIVYLMPHVSLFYYMTTIGLVFCLGWWVANSYECYSKVKDSSRIVIDEVVGMMIALLCIPKTFWWYGLAFLLFRFFDMSKLFPISTIEKNVPGGLGVMLDDVAAGLYALMIMHGFIFFI